MFTWISIISIIVEGAGPFYKLKTTEGQRISDLLTDYAMAMLRELGINNDDDEIQRKATCCWHQQWKERIIISFLLHKENVYLWVRKMGIELIAKKRHW